MKVFAINCTYIQKDERKNFHSIGVYHGLEDMLLDTELSMQKDEGYLKNSLTLVSKVFIGMPKVLERIQELSEGKIEENEAIKGLKDFDYLIKE